MFYMIEYDPENKKMVKSNSDFYQVTLTPESNLAVKIQPKHTRSMDCCSSLIKDKVVKADYLDEVFV